jgi:hypothetical protein
MSPVVGRVASWLGLAGHICTLPFFLASGLVAPLWAVIGLFIAWVVLIGVCLWAIRARSAWGLAVPFAAIGLWYVVLSAGEAIFGWTP